MSEENKGKVLKISGKPQVTDDLEPEVGAAIAKAIRKGDDDRAEAIMQAYQREVQAHNQHQGYLADLLKLIRPRRGGSK